MEKIRIETTQNVDIEYDVASVGDRLVASLIDVLICIGYLFLTGMLISSLRGPGDFSIYMSIVLSLPVLCYSLICETFMNGQSFGKRAMRIKVMRLDGRQPTFGNYIIRWVIRIIECNVVFLWVIALITIIINGKGQRLGDIAGGTLVIKLRDKERISNTAFEKVEETYVPVFPEAARLTDSDASTIKQVLRLTRVEVENITEIENKLANKLKSYLNIQTNYSDRQFLQVLLKDYNMLNGRL